MLRFLSTIRTNVAVSSRLSSRKPIVRPVSSSTAPQTPNGSNKKPRTLLTVRNAAKLTALTACAGVMYYVTRPAPPAPQELKEKIPPQLQGDVLTPEQVNKILRANETACRVDMDALMEADAKKGSTWWGSKGETDKGTNTAATPVIAYHLNQVASNSPIEDYHSETRFKSGVILGVFDGHSGTDCANVLSQYLGSYVAKAIAELPPSPDTPNSSRKQLITNALKTAFRRMDDDITNGAIDPDPNVPYSEQMRAALRPAIAGSCAIVAYIEGNELFVACTGDSRAVVGRRRGDGSFEAVPLSEDQTTANPAEHARLLEEHPDERDTVIIRGRVLGGLMPTRAFGDSRYKWPSESQSALRIRQHRKNYLTPPYVTAVPEVTHYTLDPKTDKFLILATDGIWDRLSSSQSVDLIAGYMQRRKMVSDPPRVGRSLIEDEQRNGDDWDWGDENAATCLIRNALGRGNSFMVQSLLRIPPPHSRRFRDDMTVNVVFFGESSSGTAQSYRVLGSQGNPFEEADLKKGEPKPHRLAGWLKGLRAQEDNNTKSKL